MLICNLHGWKMHTNKFLAIVAAHLFAAAIIVSPVSADSNKWTSYIEGSGAYDFEGDPGASTGVRGFLPFNQTHDRLWYVNPNLFLAEEGRFSGHLALGHRKLFIDKNSESQTEEKYILGGFAYLGTFESSFDNHFGYAGLGLEAITENYDAIVKITSPFGDKEDTASASSALPATPSVALGGDFFVIDQDGDGEFHDLRFLEGGQNSFANERALSGIDIELARRFFLGDSELDKDHIRLYANHGYYVGHRESDQDRTSIGIEFYDLGRYQYAGRGYRPYEFIIGARHEWRSDFEDRDDDFVVYAKLRVPFGKQERLDRWEKLDRTEMHMDRMVDIGHIATEEISQPGIPGEFVALIDLFDGGAVASYYEAGGAAVTTGEPGAPTELSNALASAGANGFVVITEAVPAGNYVIQTGQNIVGHSTSYAMQTATGNNVTFTAPSGNSNTITGTGVETLLTAADDSWVSNVILTNAATGIQGNGVTRNQYQDITITEMSNAGVGLNNATDVVVSNALIGSIAGTQGGTGIYAINTSSDITIDNVTIQNIEDMGNVVGGDPDGIYLEDASNVLISNSVIMNLNGRDSNGIQGEAAAFGALDNITIRNNVISNIGLFDAGGAVQSNLADGIDLDSFSNVLIEGNTISGIYNSGVAANVQTYAIRTQGAGGAGKTAVINNNIINIDADGLGVGLATTANGVGVQNNGTVTGAGNTMQNNPNANCRYTGGNANNVNLSFNAGAIVCDGENPGNVD